MPIQVGDRVRVIRDYQRSESSLIVRRPSMVGLTGIVRHLRNADTQAGVEFDMEFEGGHSLSGHIASARGWWLPTTHIEVESDAGANPPYFESVGKFLRWVDHFVAEVHP